MEHPNIVRSLTLRDVFFAVLLIATTLAFLILTLDFFQPLFWAAVLATLFQGAYQRFVHQFNGRTSLAAAVTLTIIVAIVILPVILIGIATAREVISFYEMVSSGEIDVQSWLDRAEELIPTVTEYAERFNVNLDQIRQNLSNLAVTTSQFLGNKALEMGQNLLRFALLLGVCLYVLFFFLRDGKAIIEILIEVLPLGDARERRLLNKFSEVSRATIKGTFIVGIVQGSIGGFAFFVLGIPGAVFWGVIMAVLSFLPAVGSALVWLPAAVILLLSGSIVKGLILIVIGSILIGLADNVLRPLLVGRDTKMPDYLILITTLGGLTLFGLSGVVIGPIIAALFLVVWDMFKEVYGKADAELEAQERLLERRNVELAQETIELALHASPEAPPAEPRRETRLRTLPARVRPSRRSAPSPGPPPPAGEEP